MAEPKADAEAQIKRNPHPDFKKVEASRPPFDASRTVHFTQTPQPSWTPGSGSNNPSLLSKSHREINPYADGRPPVHNYKLLISGIVPRPVGFVSTISADGTATNLAPFSYFNVVSHDPPLFVLGFSGGLASAKDSLANLLKNEECTLNIISEDFIEAANYTSLNAPLGISEWAFSGLHPAKSSIVKPDRVHESVFSIEAKLVKTMEWESRATPGKKTGVTAIVEGVNFWVREDAVDEEGVLIDPKVLKPICRLGGITYGRVTDLFELLRPQYEEVTKDPETAKLAKLKTEGQLE
ncbi:hypothetical protein BU23DRAFT_481060 [Bimuria novae-zelandiae CBS 107.79]|uniref:Flavin reductase like domain-containing protein n=1 Tax=Bimuria novae-zelandiae CBS 107.79 TaxID=1447943 RepID=A0A6A5UWR7_9PLEO|nr:hypothetical protein BU23DRAFT_481060 [Bimuria novae-zelandiae CBS 107.79]